MRPRQHWRWLSLAVAVSVGCPGDPFPTGARGAGGAGSSHASSVVTASGAVTTNGATSSSAGAGGGACAGSANYPGPKGWVGYTDYQCNGCRLYVPESKAALPPPIKWEKCPGSPAGINCQSLVIDWTSDPLKAGTGNAYLDVSTSPPVLGFGRWLDGVEPYSMVAFAQVDGAVRNAMLVFHGPGGSGCFFALDALNEGRFIYSVLGDDANGQWSKSPHKGGIGGSIDELHPKLLAAYDDGLENSWWTTSTRIFRLTGPSEQMAYDWDMQNPTLVTSPKKDPEGLAVGPAVASGENFFWTSDNLYTTGINSWNPVDGPRPFIRFIGDWTRGARNLGTDGKTLVWSYGEGKKPSDYTVAFPVRSIMAAPYTTDPTKLAPKRLRTDPNIAMSGGQFRVACGRAANGGGYQPVIIVRLSDGVSWQLPPESKPDFFPKSVIGLTCDHLYVWGEFGGRSNIARVSLDSLGPGIPPD